jgi:chromosome segregation ATPase
MAVDWPQVIVSAFVGGGVFTAIGAAIKARPEAARIVVGAAEGAVVVQASVITSLNNEIARLRAALDDALKQEHAYKAAVDQCEREIDEARVREHTLQATLQECAKRADGLERQIGEITGGRRATHNHD